MTPSTGVKVQAELDYRHAGDLALTRYYHSFRSYEPLTTVPDSHTQKQFGAVWRSNFDKRVIPITGSTHVAAALTLPTGEIQYFDTTGKEIYNYRGGTSRLVSAPEGYFYLGPEDTEFYGTDGRLKTISRRTGQVLTLTYSDGTTGPNGGVVLDPAGNPTSVTLPANLLVRVTDSYGNVLSFGYSAANRVVVMTDPAGGRFLFSYDANSNLLSVKYPDDRTRTYRYNEPANMLGGAALRHALTSIVDENDVVFASYKYDTSGRSVSSEHAGGVQRYQLLYNTDGTTSVTDPLQTARIFGFQTTGGLSRFTGASQPGGAGYGAGVQGRTYDTKGNLASQTDFNGVKTCYAYDAERNLETVRVEGLPSATNCAAVASPGASLPPGSRMNVTEWHPRWRLAARTSEPGRRITYLYNGDSGTSCAPAGALIAEGSAAGQPIAVLCDKVVQATTDANGSAGFGATLTGTPRVWTYAYTANGQLLTVDGPRTDISDVTTYSYYANDASCGGESAIGCRGQVASITNAAGHITQISEYNAHGQPLSITDPNGLVTTLVYDSRLRLTSRNVGGETTTYAYDNAGQLTRVTLPDGSFLEYGYDAAHRLTEIRDSLGNRIVYTLDAMGNRTQEQVFDPANQLAQARSRVYNSLNRLSQEIGAQNQITSYGYDNQGNLTSVDGPLDNAVANDVRTYSYDALNRLITMVDPPGGGGGTTAYGYTGLDQLASVSDPRSLVTSYSYDGLGNLNQQLSPDTGTTTNTYDAAGNLRTSTDAKGQVTSYTYDVLNRVTSITYHGGATHTYQYDQGVNGKGRLTSVIEPNSTTQYGYDPKGRLVSETRTINAIQYVTGYGYDTAGRLTGMTYPSGRTVSYTLDSLGRIQQITTIKDGALQTVLTGAAYRPFGPVQAFSFGNGQTYIRGFDQDGRAASYTLGNQSFALGYDAASRIAFLSDIGTPANSNTYSYDPLDRLTQTVTPGTPFAYGYDAVGNRLTKTVGAASGTYSYSPTSNRLTQITGANSRTYSYDPNGSITGDSMNSFGYDSRGRLTQAVSVLGTTNYQVNSLGQRIRKTNIQGDTVYHYDAQGRLIAETSASGRVQKEYIYLGDTPVAVIQ